MPRARYLFCTDEQYKCYRVDLWLSGRCAATYIQEQNIDTGVGALPNWMTWA